MKFLTDSEDACVLPAQAIGGKAFHLGQLNRINVPVPRWCVISADALETRIHSRSAATDSKHETRHENDDSLVLEKRLHLSADDLAELKFWIEQRQREGHHRFIVRSSETEFSTDIDCLPHSPTGHLESFPNLLTMDGIQAAVLKCVLNANSIKRVAVILQVMIDADAAGVLITADPKDGSRRKFLISANYGACESVVGGQFECDEFAIDLESQIVERRIAKKLSSLRFSSHSHEGLTKYTVPPHLQSRQCIEEKDLAQLIVLGKQLTVWSKNALDIEWVQQGNTIWIVQLKPLTHLGLDHSPSHAFTFDNTSLVEAFDGPVLPLTFSFAAAANSQISRQLCKFMGIEGARLSNHHQPAVQILAMVKGRIFNNMTLANENLQLVPWIGLGKKALEELLGVERSVDLNRKQSPKNIDRITGIAKALRFWIRVQGSFLLSDYIINDFRSNFSKTYKSFQRTELPWMKTGDIFKAQARITNDVTGNLRAPIVNRLQARAASDRLRQFLTELEVAEIQPDLLAGEELESLRPTKLLIQIAEQIRKNPALSESLISDENDFYRELHQSPKIESLIEDFIENYGDRVNHELKLETETVRESRQFLTRILKSYVKDVNLNLAQLKGRQEKVRNAAELRVKDLIHTRYNPLQQAFMSWRFKSALRKFRKSTAQLEAIQLDRARVVGITRSIYLELGQRLVNQGFLKNSREVFYLTTNEVHDFFHGRSLFDEPSSLIHLRQRQYADWLDQTPSPNFKSNSPFPKVFVKPIPLFDRIKEGTLLSGQGCFPGIVDGEVCVSSDPKNEIDVRGKILVIPRIDSGWIPLLLQCKGLVIESMQKKSTAIGLARELGLPTVTGIEGISRNLQNGMHLRLDGKTGTLTVTKDTLPVPTIDLGSEKKFSETPMLFN